MDAAELETFYRQLMDSRSGKEDGNEDEDGKKGGRSI